MFSRILKLLISVFYLPFQSVLLRKNKRKKCTVLYYHDVEIKDIEKFRYQMNILLKYSYPISIDRIFDVEVGQRYSLLTFDDGFVSVFNNVIPVITEKKIPLLMFMPVGYIGKSPGWQSEKGSKPEDAEVMNISQLLDISSNPLVSIGSHTMSHSNLTMLNDSEAIQELSQSKMKLERILENKVESFSFPYGAYNDNTVRLCFDAGYKYIFTTDEQAIQLDKAQYVFGRFSVSTKDWSIEFFLKLKGAYSWLPKVLELKRRILAVGRK